MYSRYQRNLVFIHHIKDVKTIFKHLQKMYINYLAFFVALLKNKSFIIESLTDENNSELFMGFCKATSAVWGQTEHGQERRR